MKELALFVVKRLVDKPESVTVEESQDGSVTVLKLNVDESDKGKVIGKQGKVIKAIRAVIGAAATKAGVQVDVEID
jgi:predicted RNA-binding protein YlqC (UPF0109 family)